MNEPASSQKPLSVCMISDDFLPGATGVGTHVQTISDHLVRRGHRISVITTRRRGEPAFEVWRGVRVHRVPTLKVAGFYQALPTQRRLARILDEERPDLIHQHYLGFMLLQVMKAAKARGIPQVYTYHMTVDVLVQPWFMRPLRPLLDRQIVQSVNRMDHVIAVSRAVAVAMRAQVISPSVEVISNPVDMPDPSSVTPAPRGEEFIVMYAGRLEPEKNVQLLLEIFRLLVAHQCSSELWIAGTGSLRPDLHATCRRLGIEQQVRFLGQLGRAELARCLAACDVFVLPSKVETQGLVALEALWFGKPVLLASSIEPAQEIAAVNPGVEIFDHLDPCAAATALMQLASASKRSRADGKTTPAGVALRYGTGAVIDRLEASYRALRLSTELTHQPATPFIGARHQS